MRTLYVTVGLPRSGKTTWARQQGFPIVNPDSIRLALHGQRFAAPAEPFVWAIAFLMIEALFLAGHHTVIVDGCHTTEKRRAPYLTRFGETADVRFENFAAPREECIARARAIGDEEIIPVIERMAAYADFFPPEAPR